MHHVHDIAKYTAQPSQAKREWDFGVVEDMN